jgi:FlaA1/EpsC-like NDP-sugar epimerase
MKLEAILAGPSHAVRDAFASLETWARPGLRVNGAVVVGGGETPVPVISRAPAWEALSFVGVNASAVILTETPPAASLRPLLARAADSHLKIFVIADRGLRPLRLSDVVGRPLRDVDWASIGAAIAGKRVFITGGGGSIGSELARRVAGLAPARLTLLDSSEFNLHRVNLELPKANIVLADIRDAASMRRWLARETPDIVFHAAALKQVPLVEAFVGEGILTNVCGLRNVTEAAHAVGADLIFVSTDKAVEPSGLMGASKRLGELYCQALDRRGGRRAIPVRLGNVLGSAGSVAPVFERQLAAGGPLTVTDAEVTRFFMSIPQAADALLQAGVAGLAAAKVRGAALTIDMGEALPIVELARDMIRLEGQRPEIDVPITFTGLRPGEKLHERLVASEEWRERDPIAGVIAAASTPRELAEIHAIMDRLASLAHEGADEAVARELFAALALVEAVKPRAAVG